MKETRKLLHDQALRGTTVCTSEPGTCCNLAILAHDKCITCISS